MFPMNQYTLWRRLSFRLTLWYSLIFTLCAAILLLIFYMRVAYITGERMDDELEEEMGEFADIMRTSGLQAVIDEIRVEEHSEAPGAIFMRLLSLRGSVLTSTDTAPWGGQIPIDHQKILQKIREADTFYETIDLVRHPYAMRAIYQALNPYVVMQIGASLEESDAYLDIFRQLLLLILAPVVLISAVVGGFMANQALADVDAVARTAEEIANGNTHRRVKIVRQFVEIERLASSFNTMVDQLHTLIKQMREMTDNIAHDLRSPLTRIRGFAEMTLIGHSTPADFQEMAVNTVEECDNLIHMINTMLDIAEAESGIGTNRVEPVELGPLIDDACALFNGLASHKGIHLQMEVPDSAVVLSDKGKLQRMITNLLENAIKYTPMKGRVSVSVQLAAQATFIQVKDTGIGIAAEEQTKIFQRFYRCDASRSEAGMGLGLSLVKAFSESLGGSLLVSSIPDRGSTFTICMPAGIPT